MLQIKFNNQASLQFDRAQLGQNSQELHKFLNILSNSNYTLDTVVNYQLRMSEQSCVILYTVRKLLEYLLELHLKGITATLCNNSLDKPYCLSRHMKIKESHSDLEFEISVMVY